MPEVRHFPLDPPDGDPLVCALRALPAERPPQDDWARMAMALRARAQPESRPGRRLRWWPAAAAAVMVATLMLPRPAMPPAADDPSPPAAIPAATDVSHLIARSQWLERLVNAEALTPVAYDADQLLIDQGLRARIGEIDLVLASDDAGDPRLWQARVAALTQLAGVQWAARQGDMDTIDTGGLQPAALRWAN